MSKFRFEQEIANRSDHEREVFTSFAKVTKADEKNNTCSIQFVDKEGRKSNRDNVTVRLYGKGTDWFPEVDDVVEIEQGRDTLVIIARHVDNYEADVRSKQEMVQDIYSDSMGCDPGGFCY